MSWAIAVSATFCIQALIPRCCFLCPGPWQYLVHIQCGHLHSQTQYVSKALRHLFPDTILYVSYVLRHNRISATLCMRKCLFPDTILYVSYVLRHNRISATLCMRKCLFPDTILYVSYVLRHNSISATLCMHKCLFPDTILYVSYVPRHNSISTTICMHKCLFPDTICFLCPETQQYIHYSLYAQVLISRHNMFLMSWAVALLQYLLFFVWGAIPRHKGIKCTRFVVGSGWSLWPKGIESYVIFSSMDDSFC